MKRFAILLVLLFTGCNPPNALPNLGDRYKIRKTTEHLMVASAQTWPYEKATFDGVMFQVATNNQGKVAYLATDDPAFKTQDGISISSTLEDVLKAGATPTWYEPGWAHHTKLPSGWSVAFNAFEFQDGRIVEVKKPTARSKVAWLFKRK